MPAEKKSGKKFETVGSASLKKQFKKRCKDLNVSQAQRLRDLIQKDLRSS